jgi:hypothetical protein
MIEQERRLSRTTGGTLIDELSTPAPSKTWSNQTYVDLTVSNNGATDYFLLQLEIIFIPRYKPLDTLFNRSARRKASIVY